MTIDKRILDPFLSIARGIPENWPGECVLRIDSEEGGSLCLSYHKVGEARGGVTIGQWRKLIGLKEDGDLNVLNFAEVLEGRSRSGLESTDPNSLIRTTSKAIHIHHNGPDSNGYPIDWGRLKTQEQLIGWVNHLLEKNWSYNDVEGRDMIAAFVRRVCNHRGWNAHGN
jgi:hypothetical protein